MDPRASEIFTHAMEVPDEARHAFVTAACGNDNELEQRVRQMLADAHKADEFFGGPLGEMRIGNPNEKPKG